MFRRLLLLVAVCLPVLLFAQEGASVPDYARLLPGKWEVVVAYAWVEFPDGKRLDQSTETAGKIEMEFGADGSYRLTTEGDEPLAGTYRLEGATLIVTTEGEDEQQSIEHLNDLRCVISTFDADPESDAMLRMRMVMMRAE